MPLKGIVNYTEKLKEAIAEYTKGAGEGRRLLSQLAACSTYRPNHLRVMHTQLSYANYPVKVQAATAALPL